MNSNSRETEEPFDDVLDLGVTEGDDLDSELQESQEPEKMRHMKDPNLLHRVEQQKHGKANMIRGSVPSFRVLSNNLTLDEI
jgi:hypothetical protein